MARRIARSILIALFVTSVMLATSGCGADADTAQDPDVEVPPGVNPDPEKGPGVYSVPPEPDLTTPEASVRAYLEWISFAYRLANSEQAVDVMSPYEHVRVDAYVQLNREQNQALEQRLDGLSVRSESIETTRAVLATTEDWSYRYFSLDSIEYTTDLTEASYEVTYTLVLEDGKWLVDEVQAAQLAEVP